jgi:radical SAM-linked protein
VLAPEVTTDVDDLWPPTFRPDPGYADPVRLGRDLTDLVLPLVGRPARYIGGELGTDRRPWDDGRANILLTFPDAYEIGMSHTGLRVLLAAVNRRADAFADLAFAPWPDMEARMRELGLPLFGLGTRRPASSFDVVGVSLCYELCYTNLLSMLDLAGLPLAAATRRDGDPVVIAGGACVLNPAVIAPFVDVVFLGDGEEIMDEVAAAVGAWKRSGAGREDLVARLVGIEGAWRPGAGPARVRVLADLNAVPPPPDLVPTVEPVHDRLSLEVMRGCTRGCRFCQAGMVHRPVRERDPARLRDAAVAGVAHGGWDEISLLSLSTSDYSGLGEAVRGLRGALSGTRTNLVLPSLRVDSLDADLYAEISREAPGSFTFAPEAGSQRLRDVINKQITEADVIEAAGKAFASGAKHVKLYFMIGLPTETNADLDEIVALVGRVVGLAPRGGAQVNVAISPFAPKPHTPFQWAGQLPLAEIERRNAYLERRLRRLRVKVGLRDPEVSRLEALLGIGDGRLAGVLLRAWRAGARFDGWTEEFRPALWAEACAAAGIDPERELAPRDPDLPLPWDGVAAPLDRAFLEEDWERARRGDTLSDCRLAQECYDCQACAGGWDHVFAAAAAGAEDRADAAPAAQDAAAASGTFDPRNADPEDPSRERPVWASWRQQAAHKCWYRVEYAKEGDARFLGHLDFQRHLQLALRRSGLPTAYSRGYHPHPLVKYGPPLPVGVAGEREVLDLALLGELPGWPRRLNAALPAGIRVRRALVVGAQTPPPVDHGDQRHEYEVVLPAPGAGGLERGRVAELVEAFLASETWPWLRRRPKGDVEVDARTLVPADGLRVLDDADGDAPRLRISLLREAGASSLPVHDLLAAVCGRELHEPRLCRVVRRVYRSRSTEGHWLTPMEEVGETSRRLWLRMRLYA